MTNKSLPAAIFLLLMMTILSGCNSHPCPNFEITESDALYRKEIKKYPNLAKALEVYNIQRDFKKAFNLLEPLANSGSAIAQLKLGALYDQGWSVPRDEKTAFSLYEKAARQGHPGAQFNLAQKLRFGQVVEVNEKEAMKWYCESAKQGVGLSIFMIGNSYIQGITGMSPKTVSTFKQPI